MMKTILVDDLRDFAVKALVKTGVSGEDADTIADVLVTTDTFGVYSHGTKNLYDYIRKMKAGGLDPKAVPTIEAEGPAWAVLNGNAAMGMVSACKAMRMAIEKAKAVGISYVGVKNSCHFGAAGYYSNLAAQQGLIGIAMSNTDPNMAIPNSRGVAIGNNPFSYAAPLKDGRSVFLDIALSSVAALKVVMAKAKGEPVPKEWLVDSDGQPTTDAGKFPYEAFLQPMAAHKGYGLAVMAEILCSVLTGSGLLSEIKSWNLELSSKTNTGHAFIAIDAAAMLPKAFFEDRMARMARELRETPTGSAGRIFLPGEMEWEKREHALKSGIALTDAVAETLEKLSAETQTSLKWLND